MIRNKIVTAKINEILNDFSEEEIKIISKVIVSRICNYDYNQYQEFIYNLLIDGNFQSEATDISNYMNKVFEGG